MRPGDDSYLPNMEYGRQPRINPLISGLNYFLYIFKIYLW